MSTPLFPEATLISVLAENSLTEVQRAVVCALLGPT